MTEARRNTAIVLAVLMLTMVFASVAMAGKPGTDAFSRKDPKGDSTQCETLCK